MQELGATVQQGSYLAEGLAKVLMHHNPANAAGLEGPEMLEVCPSNPASSSADAALPLRRQTFFLTSLLFCRFLRPC